MIKHQNRITEFFEPMAVQRVESVDTGLVRRRAVWLLTVVSLIGAGVGVWGCL